MIGLSAIATFIVALFTFGLLHNDFHFLTDYISKLGYKGTPLALWWNLIGFGLTGLLLVLFGFRYGRQIRDKLVGTLLSFFGLGFVLAGVPFDLANESATVSKVHIAAITLGLAAWLFGLARLGSNKALPTAIRKQANLTAGILTLCMMGSFLEFWTEPIAERLVFGVVFSWTALSAFSLLKIDNKRS